MSLSLVKLWQWWWWYRRDGYLRGCKLLFLTWMRMQLEVVIRLSTAHLTAHWLCLSLSMATKVRPVSWVTEVDRKNAVILLINYTQKHRYHHQDGGCRMRRREDRKTKKKGNERQSYVIGLLRQGKKQTQPTRTISSCLPGFPPLLVIEFGNWCQLKT